MRICAGIVTWQDGDALTNAIASIRDVVDVVVLADGLIDGLETDLPPTSPREQLERHNPDAWVSQRWPSQSAQRQWTLDQAKAFDCDWLFAIDADEQLVNPQALRPWLEVWGWDAFPIPFYFSDGKQACPCGFKLLHVPYWERYVCQGSMLENTRGETVQVIGQTWWTHAKERKMPYLIHRPELRPAERQSIRLSEHENRLESYPPNMKAWLEPTHAPLLLEAVGGHVASLEEAARLGLPLYYCPGCGRRYAGPGICETQHPPIALEPFHVAQPELASA